MQQGATLRKVLLKLPNGINFSDFTEKIQKDIRNQIGNNVYIQTGDEPNTIAISIPLDKRQLVLLGDLIDTDEFRKFANTAKLPVVIGTLENGDALHYDLTEAPHLLEAGATKSGKTQWIIQMILTLLLIKSPQELSLYLIDPKMIEFPMFKPFPHVKKVITEVEDAICLIGSLTSDMDQRYKKFAALGVRSIERYNEKTKETMPYVLCIVDEVADLMITSEDRDKLEGYILRLAQKARGAGIHLILATQRPSVQIITGDIKANLPSRVCFSMSKTTDYKTILDQKPPKLLGRGDGVVELEGVYGLQRFQGALIAATEEETDKVIQRYAKEWNQRIGKQATLEKKSISTTCREKGKPTTLERAKYFIAEHKDTRVRSMQQFLKINSNEMKSIYDSLVSEEWLEKLSSTRGGYDIIVDEDKLTDFKEMFVNSFVIEET